MKARVLPGDAAFDAALEWMERKLASFEMLEWHGEIRDQYEAERDRGKRPDPKVSDNAVQRMARRNS